MERRVDQRIGCDIAVAFKRLHDLFGYIVMCIVKNVGDILDQQCKRLKRADISQVAQIKIAARIKFERIGMDCNFPKLRASDARISLTGRAADQYIDRPFYAAEAKVSNKVGRLGPGDIPCLRMRIRKLVIGMEIESVGARGERVKLYGASNLEAGPLKAEANSAST
ncbi:hypothetical protein GCM10022211_14720 [Sphingomonas humi]|uniref:Uncharacterized protein n=1 Tax=Sphingomonas humi TaxID=335630 RepID=A0ABP7RY28_9SPHN